MLREAQAQLLFSGKLTAPRPQDACSHLSPGNITALSFLVLSELQVLLEASFDHFWVRMHLSTHMWGGVLHHSQGLEATGDRQVAKLHAGYAVEPGSALDRKEKMQRERSQSQSDICSVILFTRGVCRNQLPPQRHNGAGKPLVQVQVWAGDVYKVLGGDGYTWMALKLLYLQLPW